MRASKSFYGSPEVAQVLIKAGTNVNIEKEFGKTALMYAAERGYFPEVVKVVQLLIKAKANVNTKDNGGNTALDYVPEYDSDEVRRLLQDAMKKK